MKIPHSVRLLYEDLLPAFGRLKTEVDRRLTNEKPQRWHYESRLKADESYALKLETGRVPDPKTLEDFFACTLVVENRSRVDEAETLVRGLFDLRERRPRNNEETRLAPSSFEFDDLRLYVAWRDDPAVRPSGLAGMVFEVQVKTFLQHAWGIATHDFIYKADTVDWSGSRIAYQVKAMLENAELSISEARKLAGSSMLNREDREHEWLGRAIEDLRKRWPLERLPSDMKRLAQTILDASWLLDVSMEALWASLDRETEKGGGANTLDLSPYGAIVASLIRDRGAKLFDPLRRARKGTALFVPQEIQIPALDNDLATRLVRTSIPGAHAVASDRRSAQPPDSEPSRPLQPATVAAATIAEASQPASAEALTNDRSEHVKGPTEEC